MLTRLGTPQMEYPENQSHCRHLQCICWEIYSEDGLSPVCALKGAGGATVGPRHTCESHRGLLKYVLDTCLKVLIGSDFPKPTGSLQGL